MLLLCCLKKLTGVAAWLGLLPVLLLLFPRHAAVQFNKLVGMLLIYGVPFSFLLISRRASPLALYHTPPAITPSYTSSHLLGWSRPVAGERCSSDTREGESTGYFSSRIAVLAILMEVSFNAWPSPACLLRSSWLSVVFLSCSSRWPPATFITDPLFHGGGGP